MPTRALVQAVKRNGERFPPDFMFQLTEQEVASLKSQSVTLPAMALRYWGRRRKAPYAFSEQGVAMLSSVLRSARAISANIAVMRAFVRLRQMVAENAELAKKLAASGSFRGIEDFFSEATARARPASLSVLAWGQASVKSKRALLADR